ncbi:hypothetical protein BQ8794_130114 [Mesorhizobium prunaredense]|uniref:Uncharacterized protein n=1 Tax=Mesorhizobium prunaredense TaxID=1631249 RepID=A0A1R3V167_9HYPH|nr:hypothetical protein BQ8794_130114 [Mesorhizobium prunaredense]
MSNRYDAARDRTRIVLTDGPNISREPDGALIDLLRRAHLYLGQHTDGANRGLTDVAMLNGTNTSEVSRLLLFAFLAPKVAVSIVAACWHSCPGRAPAPLQRRRRLP